MAAHRYQDVRDRYRHSMQGSVRAICICDRVWELSKMNVWVYVGIAVAVVAGVWYYGETQYTDGREYEKGLWLVKMAAADQAMNELKRRHADELRKREAEADAERHRANARIEALIASNQALRDWWQTRIPADAVAFAWGLSSHGSRDNVPPRPEPSAGDRPQ